MTQLLGDMVTEFLVHLQAKGDEKATIEFYRLKLPQIVRELGNPPLEAISRGVVRSWLAEQHERLGKPHYSRSDGKAYVLGRGGLHVNWRVLRAFLNYLAAEQLIENVTEGFRVKNSKPHIESLTNTEILALLECTQRRTLRYRERALLTLWLDTGLRPREMIELALSDLDFRGNVVTVKRGKTGASRTVPFGANAYKALQRYLRFEREHMDGPRSKGRLWLSWRGIPLSQKRLSKLMNELQEAAGLSRSVFPYLFRHTFARLYLVNGGDAFTLCRLLGHSSMHMTLTYVSFFRDELIQIHGRVSPADNIQ